MLHYTFCLGVHSLHTRKLSTAFAKALGMHAYVAGRYRMHLIVHAHPQWRQADALSEQQTLLMRQSLPIYASLCMHECKCYSVMQDQNLQDLAREPLQAGTASSLVTPYST